MALLQIQCPEMHRTWMCTNLHPLSFPEFICFFADIHPISIQKLKSPSNHFSSRAAILNQGSSVPPGDIYLLSWIREGTTGVSMRQGHCDIYQQNKLTKTEPFSTKVWRNPKERQMKITRPLPKSWGTAEDLSDGATCTLRQEEKQSKLQSRARHENISMQYLQSRDRTIGNLRLLWATQCVSGQPWLSRKTLPQK